MAEDFKHIDQIIRQKFENFEPEPPLHVWENIKSGISKTPPPPSSPGILLPIIVTVSLLIFVAGLVHHFGSNNPENLNPESSVYIQSASLGTTGSTTSSDGTLQEEFYQTPSEIPAQSVNATPGSAEVSLVPVRLPFDQNVSSDRKKKSVKTNTPSIQTNASRTGQWKPGLVQAVKAGELSYADAVKYDLSMRDIRKFSDYKEYSKTKLAAWSIGMFLSPEMTSCQDASIDNSISYNIGIMPRVSFNRFYIQSGINARFTHDKGSYAVDYNRYLGTYEDVYLITFDTVDNVIIPTYYTNTVEVYDTISHYAISQTKANYTYLEIPVLLGYRHSFGKFGLFANAGPSASFLVGKNIPNAENPEEKAKIVNVDYQVPLRSTINWQMLMGAGFDYQLADRISFSLEPTFRFALKTEYSLPDNSNAKTRSFGIRAGLNYKF